MIHLDRIHLGLQSHLPFVNVTCPDDAIEPTMVPGVLIIHSRMYCTLQLHCGNHQKTKHYEIGLLWWSLLSHAS